MSKAKEPFWPIGKKISIEWHPIYEDADWPLWRLLGVKDGCLKIQGLTCKTGEYRGGPIIIPIISISSIQVEK